MSALYTAKALNRLMDFGNEDEALEEVIDYFTTVNEKEFDEGEIVHITTIMTKINWKCKAKINEF